MYQIYLGRKVLDKNALDDLETLWEKREIAYAAFTLGHNVYDLHDLREL